MKYTLQVAVEDCTGCGICVDVCPARNKSEARLKAINHAAAAAVARRRARELGFLPLASGAGSARPNESTACAKCRCSRPLFEFSGACAGCGETPYLKLLTQLFGDRLIIANATGCSSIYGGNLPTTPWTTEREGRGPAWAIRSSRTTRSSVSASGFRSTNSANSPAELLQRLAPQIGETLATEILDAEQKDEADIFDQRERVAELKRKSGDAAHTDEAQRLLALADTLVRKSVWIVGGDGWGYDIGYGGLDHVLASGRNVKVLVLDTEVYSNTGGQCSKATRAARWRNSLPAASAARRRISVSWR